MNYARIEEFDHTHLLECYYQLEDKISWLVFPNKGRQASIQYAVNEDVFLSSTGTLQPYRREKEYNLLNPLFSGTMFEDIIKKYNLVRTRLMWSDPRSCYSLHYDLSWRLHIPLITNKDCRFVFPDNPEIFHLPVGGVYMVDTTKTHSFCNFSTKPRLHLLGCCTH
jgi:hypothetical protein